MKKKFLLLLVLFSALLASRHLFRSGYFLMHDDLQMMRQLEMEKCWQDGQIPCRWVPDMGFGYGYPLFNFYPPLPFYIGQIFRWVGFSFVTSAKLIFALQFFLSGITMFVLASSLWGLWGGLLSSIFYIWAPYHSVDIFVRGAVNEAWAFVWFPLIFWAAKELVEKEKLKQVAWLAFAFGMLLLTHNIMVLIFVPAMMLWIFYWMIREGKLPWQNRSVFIKFCLAAFWALGLAAFFSLPMIAEQKFTQIETMFSGYFDWRAHFVSLRQLFFTRFWGWGPSLWGQDDGMPFPVGQIHWLLGLVIIGGVFLRVKRSFKKLKFADLVKDNLLLAVVLFLLGLGYAFLAHQRSVFIWRGIEPLQLAQFPWRLLTGAAFFFSLPAGAIYLLKKSKRLVFVLIFLVIAWNWNFFEPERMGPLTDAEKFAGRAWEYQQTAGIYDYLPKTAATAAKGAPDADWWLLKQGNVVQKAWVNDIVDGITADKGTDWFVWQGKLPEPLVLRIAVLKFPGWRVWVDGAETPVSFDSELGRMEIELSGGDHRVEFRFTNTPIRSWANLFSLLSWLALIGFWVKTRKSDRHTTR